MAPKRKRPAARRSRTAKLERHMIYCLVGGVSPGLLIRIGKAGYGITKALGEHQTKRVIKIAKKRRREVEQGKRKRYAGKYRSKTRCNENANVNAGKEKADNTLTYRLEWTPRPCLRQA